MAFNPDLKVTTGKVRLSYVHLEEPVAFQDGDPKYSATLMISKDDKKTLDALKRAVRVACQEQWDAPKPPKGSNPVFKDGDKESEHKFDGGVNTEKNPEYAGHYIISASNRKKVPVFDKHLNLIDPEEAYSGCWAEVSISAFAYDVRGNTGVSFFLRGVRKVRDDEQFGGTHNVLEDFEEWDDDDDDSESDDLI